jgi:hypothetical protein
VEDGLARRVLAGDFLPSDRIVVDRAAEGGLKFVAERNGSHTGASDSVQQSS